MSTAPWNTPPPVTVSACDPPKIELKVTIVPVVRSLSVPKVTAPP